jgi:multiple sugar transport system ATP-binding protein
MDEPLSNLDAKLRVQMRAEIARLQLELRVTTLYVTHDQIEALTIGSKVAVMRSGRLQQVDAPQNVYDFPANLFVAGFIGSPAMNFRQSAVVLRDGELFCRVGDCLLSSENPQVLSEYAGRPLALGFRPEHVDIATGDPNGPRLRGRVILTEALGSALLAHVQCDGRGVQTEDVVEALADGSDEATDRMLTTDQGVLHIAQLPADSRVRAGDLIELELRTERLHFFDLSTGSAIQEVRPQSIEHERESRNDATRAG